MGLDPADAMNDFRIVSIELVNGKSKAEMGAEDESLDGVEIQTVLKGGGEAGGAVGGGVGRGRLAGDGWRDKCGAGCG